MEEKQGDDEDATPGQLQRIQLTVVSLSSDGYGLWVSDRAVKDGWGFGYAPLHPTIRQLLYFIDSFPHSPTPIQFPQPLSHV